jgi:hypothetical protein
MTMYSYRGEPLDQVVEEVAVVQWVEEEKTVRLTKVACQDRIVWSRKCVIDSTTF